MSATPMAMLADPCRSRCTGSRASSTSRADLLAMIWRCWRGRSARATITSRLRRGSGLFSASPPRPRNQGHVAEAAPPPPVEPEPDDDNNEHAQELWREAAPLCDCQLGAAYLRSRGIWRWPEPIYFHPACYFGEGRSTAPAILAPVNDPITGLVRAIWRIKLDGRGQQALARRLWPHPAWRRQPPVRSLARSPGDCRGPRGRARAPPENRSAVLGRAHGQPHGRHDPAGPRQDGDHLPGQRSTRPERPARWP